MLLKFNKDKEVWELVKTMKYKVELRIEFEDSMDLETFEEIKEKNSLKNEEEVIEYIRKQFPINNNDQWMADSLGIDSVTIKEVLNVQLEKR